MSNLNETTETAPSVHPSEANKLLATLTHLNAAHLQMEDTIDQLKHQIVKLPLVKKDLKSMLAIDLQLCCLNEMIHEDIKNLKKDLATDPISSSTQKIKAEKTKLFFMEATETAEQIDHFARNASVIVEALKYIKLSAIFVMGIMHHL